MSMKGRVLGLPILFAFFLVMGTSVFTAPNAVQAAGETDAEYIVKSGDSLGKISQAFYGSQAQYKKILDANRELIGDGNLIYPGQKLRIPAAASAEADWRYHDIVDVAFVQQYAKLPQPENVMIIDSRPKQAKDDNGYIPTAVSIPDSQFDKMTDKLPQDKNTLLIFYCQGPT
jgi:LysM repeat protein